MPRKRPRNPLKRRTVEFDADPTENINISRKKRSKHKDDAEVDDTPKAFKRLMAYSAKKQASTKTSEMQDINDKNNIHSNSGSKPSKKSDRNPAPALKIMPGEKLSEFSRRVDESLPLIKARSGSPSRAHKRKQKKRAKAEAQKKKNKDESDDDEEDEMEQKKRLKREPSPDPWQHLQRSKPKFNDVVDKPPELNLPKKFLSNIPKSAGSMAKRLMLEQERRRFIDEYRTLMEQRRNDNK